MAACAVLVVCGIIFPDIAFFNRTLQPSNILPFVNKPVTWQASSALVPVLDEDVLPSDGFGDLHSALSQFEPAHYFMARTFRTAQSPWWNPYSASGTLGPETLVDVKFSPHTLITAWLFDASPASFDFGLLAIYCMGFYFMLRIFLDVFQVQWYVALVGSAVYLLNGFAISNLNTGIGQPYFLFPLVLFSVLNFCRSQNILSWLFVVLAHLIIFLANIMTTLTLTLLAVHVLSVAFFFSLSGGLPQGFRALPLYCLQVALAVIFAISLLGFQWFPVIHSFFVTDMATDFSARKLPVPVGMENLLSVFTPKHFWDFFGHIQKSDLYIDAGLEKRTPRFSYIGIVASMVAMCAWRWKIERYGWVVISGCVLLVFSYARVFGLVGFIDHVPVLHAIGNQYWGCVAAVILPVLVVLGLQNIQKQTIPTLAVLAVLLLQAIGFVYLYNRLGIPSSEKQTSHVVVAVAWWGFSVLWLLLSKLKVLSAKHLTLLISLVLLAELFSYMNTVRPVRYGITESKPSVVQFLQKNIGDGRILNIGQHGVLYPEYGALFGIRQAGTMNAGLLPWYERFFEKHFGNDTFFFLALDGSSSKKRKKTSRKEFTLDAAALDAASIKYIVISKTAEASYSKQLHDADYPLVYSDSDALVFENADYLPSLSLMNSLFGAKNLDPHRTVITEDQTLLADAKAAGVSIDVLNVTRGVLGKVDTVSVKNAEVVARAVVSQPAVLVLSDTWHPGWRATINNQPVYIGLVNEAFRGIVLPVGEHQVRFYYDPPALRYGIFASTVAGFVSVALSLWALLGRRFFYGRRTSNAGAISHLS